MTPRELYFILAPLGFSVFLALALTTALRHGWRYPYRCYTLAMLYLAACCVSYVPLFDFLVDPLHHPALSVLHGMATSLFGPILMLILLRLSQCIPAVGARSLLILSPPFLLYHLCYHFVPDTPFILLICLAYIAGVTLWWARTISLKVRFQYARPRDAADDEEGENPFTGGDITWMRSYARVIATLIIARWCLHTLLRPAASEWVRPQLLLILGLYLPAILLYEWRHSEYRYFDHLHLASAPKADPTPKPQAAEPTHDRVLRAARVQMQARGRLAPNAILPHLTAALTSSAAPAPSAGQPLAQALRELEQEGQFFLDPELTPATLAQRLGVSRQALGAHFHQQGTTFYDYIDRLRTAHAAQLLAALPSAGPDLIAQRSGYTSRSNFLRAFTNHYHCSPDQYRQSHR